MTHALDFRSYHWPGIVSPRRREDLGPVVRGGLLAGLIEGLGLAAYVVWQGDVGQVAAAAGWVLLIVVGSVVLWVLPALAAARFVEALGQFRVSISLWVVVVVVGRFLLADRLVHGLWWLAIVGTAFAWVPASWQRRIGGWVGRVLRDLAVVLVGFCSLLGLAPDVAHPAGERLAFLLAIASVALLLLAAGRRLPKFLAGAIVFLVVVSGLPGALATAPEGPNVLWILLDTTRTDHVPPYGGLARSTVIERLASEGALFEDAVTVVPKTPASVASLMTGLYPYHHGVRSLSDRLPAEVVTVAELFSSQGWHTAALVHNPWLGRGTGFGQGFRRYLGFYEIESPYGPGQYWSWLRLFDQLTARRIPRFSPQTSSAILTDHATRYLDRREDRRFFLYVHYFEPHWPYFPPAAMARLHGAPLDGDTLVNRVPLPDLSRGQMIFDNPLPVEENRAASLLYRAEVDHTLHQVGRLLDHLAELGLEEETLVVFTTDHGHSLGEHDYWYHHGDFLYDESIKIPLVLRWPGHVPAGRVVSSQVRSIDLLPTLARLAHLRDLPRVDGRTLGSLWGEEPGEILDAYLESDVRMFRENLRRPIDGIAGKSRAVRDGRFKLIVTPTPEGATHELFDLARDPAELVDLSDDPGHRDRAQALLTRLERLTPAVERRYLASTGASSEGETDGLEEREKERLRSLGYVN